MELRKATKRALNTKITVEELSFLTNVPVEIIKQIIPGGVYTILDVRRLDGMVADGTIGGTKI